MKSTISGVIVRELKEFSDPRGWLVELFREDELPAEQHPQMAYLSMTLPGVTRGPHEHAHQLDHFVFLGPSSVRLCLWDNRKELATYGGKEAFDFPGTGKICVIIPPGVVHGYKNTGNQEGWLVNMPNRLYAGLGKQKDVDEIRHELDPHTKFRMF